MPNGKSKRRLRRKILHNAKREDFHVRKSSRFLRLPIFNFPDINNKSEPVSNRIKVRIILIWWRRRDSNPRPYGCEPYALPAELRPHVIFTFCPGPAQRSTWGPSRATGPYMILEWSLPKPRYILPYTQENVKHRIAASLFKISSDGPSSVGFTNRPCKNHIKIYG